MKYALESLPHKLRSVVLQESENAQLDDGRWAPALTRAIRQLEGVSPGLVNTRPFQRFITGLEKCLWFQVAEEAIDDDHTKPALSFLSALENDEKRRKAITKALLPVKVKKEIVSDLDIGPAVEPPNVPLFKCRQNKSEVRNEAHSSGRLHLFLTPSFPSQNKSVDSSPYQDVLWSLTTQLLLWKPNFLAVRGE